MKALIWLILTAASSMGVRAADSGYLRVRVMDQNLEHHYKAHLKANGLFIGQPFSHDNDQRPLSIPYPWAPLTQEHLSADSNNTPIYVGYEFGPSCQFKFYVDFSMDGQTVLATWGPPFTAPFANLVGTIPLGKKCPANMPPPCSSDPALQKKLAWNYTKKLVSNLVNYKASVSQDLNNRKHQIENNANQAANNLKNSPTPDFDKNRQVLQDLVDKWKTEFDTVQEHAQQGLDEQKPASQNQAPTKGSEIAEMAIEEGDKNSRQQAPSNVQPGTPLGNLYDNLPELVKQQQIIYEEEPTPESARMLERQKQNVDFFRNGLMKGEAFVHVAGKMAETASEIAAPESVLAGIIGASSAICEIVNGKEYCVGRSLSDEERVAKTCEFLTKHFLPWKTLKKVITGGAEHSPSSFPMEQLEKKMREGYCSK